MIKNTKVAEIKGIDFTYDADKRYFKDGHIFCNKCHEQIDGELIDFLEHKFVISNACLCEREEEKRLKQIQDNSGIDIANSADFKQEIIDAGMQGKSFDDIMKKLNEKWAKEVAKK